MKKFGTTETIVVASLATFNGNNGTISGIAAQSGLRYDQAQKAVKGLRAKGTLVGAGKMSWGEAKFRLSTKAYNKANGIVTKKAIATGSVVAAPTTSTTKIEESPAPAPKEVKTTSTVQPTYERNRCC